jgi:hypothetical protein
MVDIMLYSVRCDPAAVVTWLLGCVSCWLQPLQHGHGRATVTTCDTQLLLLLLLLLLLHGHQN